MAKFSIGRIAHPGRMFFLALIISALSVTELQAQSEGWAAGEIVLEYVNGSCDPANHKAPPAPSGKPFYNVILKFYRDDYGITAPDFEDTYEVMVYSPDNNITYANAFPHEVTLIPNSERGVNQYCLNGNPVATQGAWYRSTVPLEIWPTGEWFFYYVGRYDGEYRSPEDRNINLGQTFYIETRFDLECGFVTGQVFDPIVNGYVPATRFNEAPRLTPTEYVFTDPVASFCVGKNYEYDIKAIKGNEVEKLEFQFAAIWREKNLPAAYITSEGYTINSPFPTEGGVDRTDLTQKGIIRFKPNKTFAGPVPFLVKNFVDRYWIDPADINNVIQRVERLSIMSQREYRFIFDNNCNSRLPKFAAGHWGDTTGAGNIGFSYDYNLQEQAFEFNCATEKIALELSEPVLAESLGLIGVPYGDQDQGFRFASFGLGSTNAPFLDDIAVDSVIAIEIINVNETKHVSVQFSKPIGPGKYYLYMKKGDDLNTLKNRCESVLPEFDTLCVIYVNENYEYNHKFDGYSYCYPSGKPPTARITKDPKGIPWYSGWKYYGGTIFYPPGNPGNSPLDDTTLVDTTYLGPRSFLVDRPYDSTWYKSKIGIGAGWWKVGFGLDYSTYDLDNGQLIEKRICYGEDVFYVDTITVEDLKIPNYDLCPKEDLPVIDLSSYKTDIISSSFNWGKWDGTTYKDFYSQYTDPTFPPPNNVKDSTGKDYRTVSTKAYIFDTKGAYTGVGDTNYFRALFSMRGKYEPTKTCPVEVEFKVLKQLVDVELNYSMDSVICEGEEYLLRNIETENYYIPEQYTFQWYLDDVAIPGETDDSLMITETGEYKLEVIKTTDGSTCNEFDSAYIRIAQFLDPVDVGCTEITFNDGQIEQLFSWSVSEGANFYEVRLVQTPETSGSDEITYGPWGGANDPIGYGINHKTIGPRLGIEVRAVNGSVDEDAACRYSDASYAPPCDAIVKSTNVFTPNGDGINDFLKFDLVEIYPGSKLSIFNRWGKMIYDNNDYFNDWDGDDFQEGTYFYILDINDPNQKIMKGTFTIIRD